MPIRLSCHNILCLCIHVCFCAAFFFMFFLSFLLFTVLPIEANAVDLRSLIAVLNNISITSNRWMDSQKPCLHVVLVAVEA